MHVMAVGFHRSRSQNYLLGVFYWGRLIGNYEFFKGQEQCLQSQLGSVVVSWFVAAHRQNIKHVWYFTDLP